MGNLGFILSIGLALYIFLFWGFRTLPGEKWQILASVPLKRDPDNPVVWQGVNLTYYGFLLATGTCLGTALFMLLLGSMDIDSTALFSIMSTVLFFSIISAKLFAVLVEKKKATFTVAGGAFTGLFFTPFTIIFYNNFFEGNLPMIPLMSALVVSYLIGEGVGRLACISFGCCYGKPVSDLSPLYKKIFSRLYLVFQGETKKISYASGLQGEKVVPIQAMTAMIYVTSGLVGTYMFLQGNFRISFLICSFIAMGWRLVSEFLRADYRGEGRFSAYQKMSIVAILFCFMLLFLPYSNQTVPVLLEKGLQFMWSPYVFIFIQVLWTALFLYTGVSKVTGSSLELHVKQEMI